MYVCMYVFMHVSMHGCMTLEAFALVHYLEHWRGILLCPGKFMLCCRAFLLLHKAELIGRRRDGANAPIMAYSQSPWTVRHFRWSF